MTNRLSYLARRSQLLMLKAGRELERLRAAQMLSSSTAATAGETARRRDVLTRFREHQRHLDVEELRLAQQHLLYVEQETLEGLQKDGLIDPETARALARAIEVRLQSLRPPASRLPLPWWTIMRRLCVRWHS